MRIAALILAAGESSRMAPLDKLTEDANGAPLLRCVVEQVIASDVDDVIVVMGANSDARRQVLDGLSVVTVQNNDWPAGMASSICAGIGAVDAQCDVALIMLGDMPEVNAALINELIQTFSPEDGAEIVVPRTVAGRRGNPVLFGKRFFPDLLRLTGDRGAQAIIKENPENVRYVLVDDAVLIDLDTPEAWVKWRSTKHG